MNPTRTMLLLTYTPRADSEGRGYEDWLREVDNPFFNSQPGIAHYTNWKIVDERAGSFPFRYFDTMFIESEAAFEAPEVRKFADGWVELWGIDPSAGHAAVNYQVLKTEIVAAPSSGGQRTDTCLFLPNTPRDDARERDYDQWLRKVDNPFFNGRPQVRGYTNWRVVEPKIGTVEYTDFDLVYVDGRDGFEQVFLEDPEAREFAGAWVRKWGRDPNETALAAGVNFRAAVAEVVASPDRT